MTVTIEDSGATLLGEVAQQARALYAEHVANPQANTSWWTAVIITASSARQAERYAEEIRWRREQGKVPAGAAYLVVPDIDDERIGSGGATLNALRRLAEDVLLTSGADTLEAWWATQRVLMIHSGGDSRRLPQFSLSGKLFSMLPVKTPWGDTSTVFDEMLALSSAWAAKLPAGLVVASGDVLLTFDARRAALGPAGRHRRGHPRARPRWARKHGVYVADDRGARLCLPAETER